MPVQAAMRTKALIITTLASISIVTAGLPSDKKNLHALNRLTFGPRPGDPEKVRTMGLKKWIDQQLHPERIPENPTLEEKLRPLDTIRMKPDEMVKQYPAARVVNQQLQEGKLYRAVYGNRQLAEVLTDFWYNHFNVYFDKGADRYLVTSYERDAIRPHVLGKFKDLLRATAEHPAMLFYLDNWQSVDPKAAERLAGRRRPAAANRRARGLNENYARELLELHTLGVDGGYTQQDIIEVARCFTGWTIRDPRRGGEFFFDGRMHDPEEKTVVGVKIPAGGGVEDGFKVLDIVSNHPSTARFISKKLAQRFVADDPPASLIGKMAKTFTKTGGDIREVMKTMLASKEFWSEGAYRAKVKSPLEMVASAVRAVDANVDSALPLALQVGRIGQPLYRKQEPTGYPNSSQEWVNSAALLARMNFAQALASNKLPGVRVDPSKIPAGPSKEPALDIGLIFGSPEFQHR